jgi:glutathione S-transferase
MALKEDIIIVVQMNPQHTIPVLVDGDVVINESRAAAQYLVNKYGWDDCKLYPSDPVARAAIDSRLYFDIGTFYRSFMDCYVSFKSQFL